MSAPLSQEAAPALAEITVTFCSDCDHVHPASAGLPPRRWLCIKHKRLPGFDRFVTGKAWAKDDPFLRCADVNGGLCELFTPKRDASNAIQS